MTAKAHVHAAAKPFTPAKPAAAKSGARAARTTTAKTTARGKAARTSSKHTARTSKPRGWAIDGLPMCSLEAVAASLRLAGQPVPGDEVAWLWELAGSRELSIPEALEAAARFGLAGYRPVPGYLLNAVAHGTVAERPGYCEAGQPVCCDINAYGDGPGALAPLLVEVQRQQPHRASEYQHRPYPAVADVDPLQGLEHALILGVDRPGPHAVLATADGWWSWGQLHCPWPCRIEEAWAVSWS